jgi:hypothetical protein
MASRVLARRISFLIGQNPLGSYPYQGAYIAFYIAWHLQFNSKNILFF